MANHQTDNTANEGDLFHTLGIMWRGKIIILSCALIMGLMGGYYAFEIAEPRYSATARLAMQLRDQQLVDLDSVISGVSTEQSALNTEVEVIRSRPLIQRLVADLNLIEDPEFNAQLRKEPKFSLSKLRRNLRSLFSGGGADTPASSPSAESILLNTVGAVRRSISVTALRNTYLFDIKATTGHPGKSAKIANRLAQIYLDDQIGIKFEAREYAINWLSDRVNELEIELKQKEDSLNALRGETNLISLQALELLNIRAKDIRDRLLETQANTVVAQERLMQIQEALNSKDAEEIVSQLDDPILTRLARNIDRGDASAQSLFDARIKSVMEERNASLTRLASQRDALQTSLADHQEQIEAQNADLSRITQLERDIEATRTLYETFLNRLKETSIQIGLQRPDARILSEANQGNLVAPRKTRILVFTLFLGALLGTAIVMTRHFIHNGFRTTDELERMSGLPVLGQIPKMPIRQPKELIELLHSQPTSGMAEAIRNLRTSLLMSAVDKPPQVIMSTSAIPGEGKTTQSIALAMNLAAMGSRVVLVECDVRRRTLNQYFDAPVQSESVLDLISGEKTIDQVAMHVDKLGADVLLSSKISINGADLFASDRFAEFIKEIRQVYDYIILDTPPVQIVPDARIIGAHVDAVVFNVAWDSTPREIALSGLQQLETVGVTVTGLVLSRVDEKRLNRYGYNYTYGGQYGKGYYDT